MLECPITGGLEALKKGQMAVWVGGDKEAYLEVKPILSASYSSVMYTGGLGTAMIPKVNTDDLPTYSEMGLERDSDEPEFDGVPEGRGR